MTMYPPPRTPKHDYLNALDNEEADLLRLARAAGVTNDEAEPDTLGRTWTAQALCAQVDPDVFFPDKGEPAAVAKAVCRACPATAPCLAWALTHNIRHGIWGGLSERERRRLATPEAPAKAAA